MKCITNGNNEITSFWNDINAPDGALDCDKTKSIHGQGEIGETQTYFYKLENGKVIATEAGIAWEAQEYARNRQAEYPDMGSQLNKIYDDGVTMWKSDMVAPVKAKWPKDNSGPK